MKKLKEHLNGIVLCLFEAIVGILLFVNPVNFTSGIITFAGIILMVLGLVEIIKYFKKDALEASLGQNLVKGIISILIGAFCVFKTDWFIITFPVLTMIYGIFILIAGIGKIQLTVDMLRLKNKNWLWAGINAIVSIVCAVVILKSPFSTTNALWMFTGAALIVEAVFDIITMLSHNKKAEQV